MYSMILALATAESSSASAGGSMVTTLITFAVIIMIFYFLIIRPQKKRDNEVKNMLAAMKKGDKIVTIGGIRGTVAVVKESTVIVKVDDNTRIEFSKNAISQVLNQKAETEKADDKKSKKAEKIEKVEKPEVEAPKAEEKSEN
ncbi:MAG: preprotein translocase subunit YajC [Sphaerochaetaceae bacterium]|nr:preprotein translocase subunit YajC [Sphaerochaetaceae bacterium]